jgi:hypothetical protein
METSEVKEKETTQQINLAELDKERICPVCGTKYNTIEKRKINGQTYIYFIHKSRDNTGKLHIKKCYAGAKESYKYVQKFQNGTLTLKGNPSNFEKYSKAIAYLEQILSTVETQKEYEEFKANILRVIWKYEKRLYQKPSQ